jgi:polar amino acid transport system permease protein
MAFDVRLFLNALTSWPFFFGALITIALSLASHGTGIVLGLGLAMLSTSRVATLRAMATIYVWLFRGAPVLLLLLFVWNALPQLIPAFREGWFTPFLAAWLALSLNETAYQSEINRAALLSVDAGQRAAAAALGLTRLQALALVVLPQALRVAVPPTVNEFITLLKTTSLASVISLQELLATTTRASNASFRYTEFYAVALVYYLAIVSVLMLGQGRLERRLGRQDLPAHHAHA